MPGNKIVAIRGNYMDLKFKNSCFCHRAPDKLSTKKPFINDEWLIIYLIYIVIF